MALANPFRWPGKSHDATSLFAKGETWESVREQAGITKRQLENWHARAEFQAEIEQKKLEIADAIKQKGIADRQNRVDAYNERWRLMQQVIAERAKSADFKDVPGGSTGLLVKTYKQTGSGRDAELLPEYAVDTPLLSSLLKHEQQAAQDLGQWDEKRTLSGEVLLRQYVGVDTEAV